MHTLLIAQNDKKLRQHIRGGFTSLNLGPKDVRYRLQIFEEIDAQTAKTLGPGNGALATIYISNGNRICRAIADFADWLLRTDQHSDVVTFQVIFLFHQTDEHGTRGITWGLRLLRRDQAWLQLQQKYRRGVRAAKCWLVSCESATDMVGAAAVPVRWVEQAANMREAAARGLRTEKGPPPSNPPEYWKPAVYTFTTGDPITGGVVLIPDRVSFRKLPYVLDANGGFAALPVPAGTNPDVWHEGTPTSGTVYKHVEGEPAQKLPLTATDTLDVFGSNF